MSTKDEDHKENWQKKLKILLGKVEGQIKKKRKNGYLQTPTGKQILELAVAHRAHFENLGGWPGIVKLLGRDKATIEKAMSFHGIEKERAKHQAWTDERIAVVKDFYERSKKVTTREESRQLRREMVDAVNMQPGIHISIGSIRTLAQRLNPPLEWGWNTQMIKDPWINAKLVERARELIEKEKILMLGKTLEEAIKIMATKLSGEFREFLRRHNLTITVDSVREKLDELIWTRELVKVLGDVIQTELPLDIFIENHPYIPKKLVSEKARRMTGVVTRAKKTESSLRGMGRLDIGEIDPKELPKYRLPVASFKEPWKIPAGEKPSLMFLIPNVGTLYKRESIDDNVPRRALAEARHRGASAVIASSIFDIDTTKAGGPNKVYRALMSGLRTDPDDLARSYQERARRILKEQKLSPRQIELVYVTFAERFDAILKAWNTISFRPRDEKNPEAGVEPEFNGPILLVFGYKEELLIAAVAYAEARYATILRQAQVKVAFNMAVRALEQAKKWMLPEAEIKERENEVEKWKDEGTRTIISDVADDLYRLIYHRTRALVIKKLEETIPNSKVIGIGSCVIQLGETEAGKVEVNIPADAGIPDNALANFVKKHGSKVLRGEMAPTTVIMHPHSLYFGEAVRECDTDGKRGEARIFMAPIAIDDKYIRSQLDDTVRKIHPISKVVFNEHFRPGVLMLEFNNGSLNPNPLSIVSLGKAEKKQKKEARELQHSHVPLMHDFLSRYIYIVSHTDLHYGSRNRVGIWCDELRQFLGVDEAFNHILRRQGLVHTSDFPFHAAVLNDDPTQGNHFQVQQQPHPHELPLWKIEEHLRKFNEEMEKSKDAKARAEVMRKAQRLILRQFAVRPPDWYMNQLLLLLKKYVKDNIDIIASTLNKARDAKIIFKGLSEFGELDVNPEDGRDVGCYNFGTSNHELKTTNREVISGPICALLANAEIRAHYDEWRDKESELDRLIRSPMYSNRTFAWGTIKAPGGYEYVVDFRDTVPRMNGWNDVVSGWVKIDPSRGNYSRIANNRYALKWAGDKHFHSVAQTATGIYIVGGPGTETDLFGEWGFPPNNTGISIVGLPKDGPDSGPIIIRYFPFSRLKFHLENPQIPFDWKAFLPNPL